LVSPRYAYAKPSAQPGRLKERAVIHRHGSAIPFFIIYGIDSENGFRIKES